MVTKAKELTGRLKSPTEVLQDMEKQKRLLPKPAGSQLLRGREHVSIYWSSVHIRKQTHTHIHVTQRRTCPMFQMFKLVHRIEVKTKAHRDIHGYHRHRSPAVEKSRASDGAGLC